MAGTNDVRIYNRALTPSEIKLLSLRRGIAYETRNYFARPSSGLIINSRRNNFFGLGY